MHFRFFVLLMSLGLVTGQTVEEYTQQASRLVLEFEWKEALQLLEAGLERHPNQPELLLQLGTLLVRSGQATRGERLLNLALELQPGNSEALRSAADAQLRQGHLSSAIDLLRESLSNSSENVESHHSLAHTLLAQGEILMALEHARQAIELNPLDPRFRRLYSFILEAQGDQVKAEEQLRLAYRLAPRDPGLLFELSERRRRAGTPLHAQEYLEMAIEIDPENPLYHDRLADLYHELGREEEAEIQAGLSRSLQTAFESYVQAMRLSVRGKKGEAILILEPIIEGRPEFVTGMMLLADLYQKLGRQSQALNTYLKILERDPLQVTAREEGAWIQVQQGFLDSALDLLELSDPQTLNRTLILAYQQMVQENWGNALDLLREVEAVNPLHAGLLQLIGYCLNALGQKDAALAQLDKAASLRPEDQDIRLQIREIRYDTALVLLNQGRFKAALKGFQELLKEDVRPEYLLRMAYSRQQLGDLSGAVREYRAGLQGDPTADWARVNFATSLYLLGNYSESATQWEWLMTDSKTAENYYQLGRCYFHLNRFPEAEQVLAKAVAMGNTRPEVLYTLGASRLRLNRADEAWDLIRRAAAARYPPARELLRRRSREQ
ncbi:MAG: tetratricopeptide repeat protein [Acidobacteriota bacterium]